MLSRSLTPLSPHSSDTQGKFKAQKFACKQRGALLTLLYQCVYLARQSLKLPVAPKLLGYGTCCHRCLRKQLQRMQL